MRSMGWMVKGLGFLLALAAMSSAAQADNPCGPNVPTASPEVDPGMMSRALSLLGGGLLLITNRSRRK